jgi:uncharacterized OB-fold protein
MDRVDIDIVEFVGSPTKVVQTEPATVVEWPRSLTHTHTYGLLSPFFEGLCEGKLRATRCPNRDCSENLLWVPPRAHCPDCHTEMVWEDLPDPVVGTVYAYARVVYSGVGLELTTPYWQIDVAIPGLATIPKSYLAHGEPYLGMPVEARFRTEEPTNTVLDYCWVPREES